MKNPSNSYKYNISDSCRTCRHIPTYHGKWIWNDDDPNFRDNILLINENRCCYSGREGGASCGCTMFLSQDNLKYLERLNDKKS